MFQINGNRDELYSRTGALGNSWIQKKVQLSIATNTYMQIEGTTGITFKSDMAVDDIQIFSGIC